MRKLGIQRNHNESSQIKTWIFDEPKKIYLPIIAFSRDRSGILILFSSCLPGTHSFKIIKPYVHAQSEKFATRANVNDSILT